MRTELRQSFATQSFQVSFFQDAFQLLILEAKSKFWPTNFLSSKASCYVAKMSSHTYVIVALMNEVTS